MGGPDHQVWQALQAYEIGPADAALSFTARLARENRWDLAFAERVVGEYKRFCYLAVTAGHEVTPSDAVDQAWHLHLTYSRDYWQRFCPEILGMPLHHGPTAGGPAEAARYFEQYAQTLKSYEAAFGTAPPVDVWPDARTRFLEHPRAFRVHARGRVILSRTHAIFGGVGLAALLFALGWALGRWQ
jgi:hypothetical protein